MTEFKMTPEDQKLVIDSLLKQMRELQGVLDVKTKQARDLSYELDKARYEERNTEYALRDVLTPLVEERAALYLIHEDEVVRRIAKDILVNNGGSEGMDYPQEKMASPSYSKGGYLKKGR